MMISGRTRHLTAADNRNNTMEKTMHAGIFVMPDGRFKISTTAKCPRTGRLKKVRRTLQEGVALHEAVMIRDQLKSQIQGEQAEQSRRPTLGAYALEWMDRREQRLKPSTAYTYRDTLKRFIVPEIGDIYVDALRRADVEDWITWAERQTQPDDQPYAQGTLNGWWRVLVTLLRDMAADLGMPDPTQRLRAPRAARRHRVRETRTLSHAELGALLNAVAAHAADRYAEVITLAYTGMRAGELYGLKWECVDMERQAIHIRHAVSNGVLTDTKTHAPREVYLPQQVADALQAHRIKLIANRHRGVHSGLVFPSNTGGLRNPASLRKPLARATDEAGIEQHVSPQVLRRTFNTLMLSQGVDHIILRSLMGHSTEAMTEHYAGVRLEAKRNAVELALLSGGVQ